MKLKIQALIFFVCAFSFLTGCATKSVPQIETRYYQQCIQPLVRMQEADNRLAQATAKSALGGAFAGAVIGLIVTASNPYAVPLGIGVGLGAGAAVGAAVGYTYAKLDQITDENTRFASIRITANQDLSKANRLQMYAYESMICYMNEFEELRSAYIANKINDLDYKARFTEIYNAMRELGKIIGKMDAELTRTEQEFNQSFSLRQSSSQIYQEPPVQNKQPATVVKQVKTVQNKSRPAKYKLVANLAEKRKQIAKVQEKNEEDLSNMLVECAGKVTPPKQNAQDIQKNYGHNYAETRQEIQNLRATHKEALSILDQAALEAGIDMV